MGLEDHDHVSELSHVLERERLHIIPSERTLSLPECGMRKARHARLGGIPRVWSKVGSIACDGGCQEISDPGFR